MPQAIIFFLDFFLFLWTELFCLTGFAQLRLSPPAAFLQKRRLRPASIQRKRFCLQVRLFEKVFLLNPIKILNLVAKRQKT